MRCAVVGVWRKTKQCALQNNASKRAIPGFRRNSTRFSSIDRHFDAQIRVRIYVNRRMLHRNNTARRFHASSGPIGLASTKLERASHVIRKGRFDSFNPYAARASGRRRRAVGDGDAGAAVRWRSSFPTAEVNTTGLAVTDTEVTVGILHSVTGTMAISETGSVQAEKLAIEQINAAGRRARPQDQVHPGGRRQRLADLRREGEEAPGQRQGRFGHGLLDLGVAQGGAAGVRAIQRHALLPDLLRRPRSIQERHLHRPGGDAADHRRPRLGAEGEGRQDLLPAGLRLHLAAHVEQDRAQAHRELPQAQGGRRGVLPARPHPVQFGDQQDQAAPSRT